MKVIVCPICQKEMDCIRVRDGVTGWNCPTDLTLPNVIGHHYTIRGYSHVATLGKYQIVSWEEPGMKFSSSIMVWNFERKAFDNVVVNGPYIKLASEEKLLSKLPILILFS